MTPKTYTDEQVVRFMEEWKLNFDLEDIRKAMQNNDLEMFKKMIVMAGQDTERADKTIAERVKDYIETTSGYFTTTDVYRDLHIRNDARAKNSAYMALYRLVEDKVIEKDHRTNGRYRRLEKEIELMDWMNAPDQPVSIRMPLKLDEMVNIFEGAIVLVAGEKDSSKTAFMLNVALLNMDNHNVRYFNVEMGEQELRDRLVKFEREMQIPLDKWQKVQFIERMDDFASVLDVDGLNIIDYLDRDVDAFLMSHDIRGIHNALRGHKGVCFICQQRNTGNEWGVGGQQTRKIPRLIINLYDGQYNERLGFHEPNVAKIKVAKTKKDGIGKLSGMVCEYNVYDGCRLDIATDWSFPKGSY